MLKLDQIRIAAIAVLVAISAQTTTRAANGSINLDELRALQGLEPEVHVNLDGWILDFARTAAKDENDPELAILEGLEALQVRVFNLDGDDKLASDMAELTQTLRDDLYSQGWEEIVRVRDKGDNVNILMRGDGEVMDGVLVMAVSDNDEAVFVNIIGQIYADTLAKILSGSDLVGHNFDVDFDL